MTSQHPLLALLVYLSAAEIALAALVVFVSAAIMHVWSSGDSPSRSR